MGDDMGEVLRASEERYRTLFEQAPVGVFLFDREGRITESNARLAHVLGSAASGENAIEALGKEVGALLPAIAATLKGESARFDAWHAEPCRGTRVYISLRLSPLRNADGDVIGGMGIVEDVTDREAAKRALETSEARFRTLIEHAPDAICVARSGRLIYVNPAMLGYLGYATSTELEGKLATDFIHLDDRRGLAERAQTRERQRVLEPREYRLLRADGQTLTAEVVSMIIDYDGGPAVLALGRDLTQRKLMEAQLLQSDRMASVGTLAAGVAHEINNPLAYVKANLDGVATRCIPQLAARLRALEEETTPSSFELSERLTQIASMIELARDGAERVRFIVRDLKIFSRAADDTSAPVDVARVLDAAVNMAWGEIRNRARVTKDYGDTPPVDANESRLGQVFLNLLANAAQAIPEGHATDNEIRVCTYVDAFQRVCISVSDTGAGIAADALARIFDPFFTTKAVGVGTGLGLWICQGIVGGMGGDIGVTSTPGRGTTITVSLPSRFVERGRPTG